MFNKKTVRDFELKGKRVLVRCDFNVPLNKKGNILDDFRIKRTIPTIEYLVRKNAKVILMSHLGRPKRKRENLNMSPIQDKLMEYLDLSVTKAPDCIGDEIEKWVRKMQKGEILLLENLRFYQEEEENDRNFARKLADLGDVFINDAFGVSHRAHASIVGIPKFLPSGAGFLLEEEIKNLSKILENPQRPFVVLIGGAKVETKIDVVTRMLELADSVLLGGLVANMTILVYRGYEKKLDLPLSTLKKIKKIKEDHPRLRLPFDLVCADSVSSKAKTKVISADLINERMNILDIGPKTADYFASRILEAKTILWNGPMGLFEISDFAQGTEKVARAIALSSAFSVIGGGETVEAIKKFDLEDKVSFISTGGGAMLEFLAGKKLPGIECLQDR